MQERSTLLKRRDHSRVHHWNLENVYRSHSHPKRTCSIKRNGRPPSGRSILGECMSSQSYWPARAGLTMVAQWLGSAASFHRVSATLFPCCDSERLPLLLPKSFIFTSRVWSRCLHRPNRGAPSISPISAIPSPAMPVSPDRLGVEGKDGNADAKSKLLLPHAFLDFLKQNGLDPDIYDAGRDLPRYVRLKPQSIREISEIEEELKVKLSPLSWLPGFFSIPPEVQIAGTKAYQEGKIYGMDAASGAAVAALEISQGDHVLDLCAAPGAKLCMMADLLENSGTLTATDISPSRLAVSRTMLVKYGLGNRCRLFLADGTTFSLLPLKETIDHKATAAEQTAVHVETTEDHARHTDYVYVDSHVYGQWKLRKTAKEKKALRRLKYLEDALDRVGGRESELLFYGEASGIVGMNVSEVFGNSCYGEALNTGYDKVLVDAECTHDGSLKHIYKFDQWGWETFERRFFNSERLTSIASLQLRLLVNGFRLLKAGGTLVYSTCSFTIVQNEDVVKSFLAMHPNSELVEIGPSQCWPCRAGGLAHSVRFDPIVSNTSGLFIAKITRLCT